MAHHCFKVLINQMVASSNDPLDIQITEGQVLESSQAENVLKGDLDMLCDWYSCCFTTIIYSPR